MILADFTGVKHNNTSQLSNTITSNNTKQGQSQSNDTLNYNNNKRNSTLNDYLQELDIPGVKEVYIKKQQHQKEQLQKTRIIQKQQQLLQSVNRLYSTGHNKSKTNDINMSKTQLIDNTNPIESEENEHQNQTPKVYYNQLHQQDQKYDRQFRVHKLETDCKFMYKKLQKQFTKKYSIWIAMDEKDKLDKEFKKFSLKPTDPKAKYTVMLNDEVTQMFIRSLVSFVLFDFNMQAEKKVKNSENFMSLQDKFTIAYSDFLNKRKLKMWEDSENKNIDSKTNTTKKGYKGQDHLNNLNKQYNQQLQQNLHSIVNKIPFIYYLLHFNKFTQQIQDNIKTVKDIVEWVIKQINTQRKWQQIYQLFAQRLDVKFTVPFQTQLYQVKSNNNNQKQNQDYNDEMESYKKFKANPIPQSTYNKTQKPQQFSKSKKPTTQPIPFNFTQTNAIAPKLTQQQFYSWNRQFKAKPVPKTLYEPQLIGINQQQRNQSKKQHQQKLYKQAKFPKTMGYLQNFANNQQQKMKQLQEMYLKNKMSQRPKPKEIPDFNKLHRQEMHLLQTRKQMNRTCTQPKPFKFGDTTNSYMRKTLKNNFIDSFQNQEKENKKKASKMNRSQSIPNAKSTAKFDAYVQLRRQQKQQKKKQIQERKEWKERQQQDKKQYKEILKSRMQNQFNNQVKAVQYNNNNNNSTGNMFKVNLQQIYIHKPLLMESFNNKNSNNLKKQQNDDSKTCFTDSYEPII